MHIQLKLGLRGGDRRVKTKAALYGHRHETSRRNRVWGKLRTASTAAVGGLARDTLMVEVDAIVYLGKDS